MILWTAVVLGFLGSFHCVGMCGPIALAVGNSGNKSFFWNKILYNVGRSITYAALGLLVGSLGFTLSLAGIQQGFSIGMGVLILILSLSYKKSEQLITLPALSGVVNWIKSKLSHFLKKGGRLAFLATGLANGLLPCGMVYMALVAALGIQSPWMGAAYMFFFGLGTIPLLLVLMYSGQLISIQSRHFFQRTIPYFGMVLGLIFIFRGLGLGLHGFSPDLQVYNYGTEQFEITLCR